MWRPKEWDKRDRYGTTIHNVDEDEIFEAGADAILETLLARGTVLYVPANQWFTNIPIIQPVNGSWVFIPEETQ